MNTNLLSRLKGQKVVVIGDIMIDEYLDGRVNRISPEAPVPVHHVKNSTYTSGGAANAARNIAKLGGVAKILSVTGDDPDSVRLCRLLEDDGICTKGISKCKDRPTIKKTRITSLNHQLMRIDWESTSHISQRVEESIMQSLKSCKFDTVLISDYGKGLLTDNLLKSIIEYSHSIGKPVVVDPKGKDFSKYLDADIITPNRNEARGAIGGNENLQQNSRELAQSILDRYGVKSVLLTLSAEGMLYLDRSGIEIYEIPTAKEVYDVSGAGDTVAAVFSLCMNSDIDMANAVHLATLAAGIVVEKWGTQAVSSKELEMLIEKDETKSGNLSPTISGFWVKSTDFLETLSESKTFDPETSIFLIENENIDSIGKIESKGGLKYMNITKKNLPQLIEKQNIRIIGTLQDNL